MFVLLLEEKEEQQGDVVPVRRVKGGYRWGKSGKIYKTRKAAERQGRAIYASGYRNGKKKRPKTKKSRR